MEHSVAPESILFRHAVGSTSGLGPGKTRRGVRSLNEASAGPCYENTNNFVSYDFYKHLEYHLLGKFDIGRVMFQAN